MKETLTQKFIKEIANIKSPEVFLGVARILKVQLMEDKDTPYDFVKIFSDTIEAFDKASRARKKELLKILVRANQYKECDMNGDSPQNSTETVSNQKV